MKKDLPKIETAEDWEKAVNFIPKKNQIIIYDGLKENGVYIKPPKIKIGDGIHSVAELPFEIELEASINEDTETLIIK